MSMYKLYIGEHIYPVGFPVVIITAANLMDSVRMSEYFILLFPTQGAVQYKRCRLIYRNIPDSVLNEESLLEGTLETVNGELDLMVHKIRTKLSDEKGVILPFSLRFTLNELSQAKLRFLFIRHNLARLARQICRETYSEELKQVLPQWPPVNQWAVEVDPQLTEQENA